MSSSFGMLMQSLRLRAGFESTVKAAEELSKQGPKITYAAIRKIERGKTKKPPLNTVLRLCRLYGVDDIEATRYYNEAYGEKVTTEIIPDKDNLVSPAHVERALSLTETGSLRDRIVKSTMQIIDDYGMRDKFKDKDGVPTQAYHNIEGSLSRAVELAIREVTR